MAILIVTSPIVINVQPEGYWLSKQRILLFCGWQNLNIKRLVNIAMQHHCGTTGASVQCHAIVAGYSKVAFQMPLH